MALDPKVYFVGAADVLYRAVGGTGAWSSVGSTLDDTVVRIQQSFFTPDNINNQLAPLRELDYLSNQFAEAEFTMAEIGSSKLALAVPNAVTTTRATTDATGTPGSTTLAAAASIGDTAVKVTAITNFAPEDYIRIGTGAGAEYRQIHTVGTLGAGGTGLQFRDPLMNSYANGVVVVETVGDGKTVISPTTVRRQPVTAYNDWVLRGQSPAGYSLFYIYNGFSMTSPAEITMGDETLAGIRVTVQSRDDGTGAPNWAIEV